jgi:hypothetical protein
VLAASAEPLDAAATAKQFVKQRMQKKIGETLLSLARLGYGTSGNGKTFVFRRVAQFKRGLP